MKKIFLSMLTAVALFASCSQEELVSQTSDEESMVSFTLTTPEMGSRAAGDGTTATDLYYAVYDETTGTATIVEAISKNGTEKVTLENKTATINLPLLNGHKYSLLFWAENTEGAYEINWSEKSISLNEATDFTLTSNVEEYDAFYAYVEPFVVTGDKTENVKLYRPFAQLNIGTTQADIDRVDDYFKSDALSTTQIVISNVPTTMDLATGVVGAAVANGLTYTLAAFADIQEETFPVAGYEYISMNYILVGKSEKTLVDVTLTTNINGLEARTYKNVPLQGNYRTNIYGELFTSNSDWNVNIEDEFGTPAYEVLDGVIELTDDVELSSSYRVTNSLAINLNGKTLSYSGDDILMRVENGATLTINGPGKIETSLYVASANEGGTIYVNGGEFLCGTTCFQANGGKIYISGGKYEVNDEDKRYVLNHIDGQKNKGLIEVTGGAFVGYDPSDSDSENPAMNFVKEGYKVTNIDGVYCVTKATATAAVTAASLSTALATAGDVEMVVDVETASSLVVAPGATLNGQGNTVTMTKNETQYMFTPQGGTIQNINIEGYGERNSAGKVIRGIYIVKPTENVIIDGATVSGVAYPLNTGTKSTVENLTLTVNNSTLIGWSSWDGGFVSASFTNCTFGIGTYFSEEAQITDGWNGCARPYVTTTFENCTFEEGFILSLSNLADGATITFKNCKVGDKAITSDNVATSLNIVETGKTIVVK